MRLDVDGLSTTTDCWMESCEWVTKPHVFGHVILTSAFCNKLISICNTYVVQSACVYKHVEIRLNY